MKKKGQKAMTRNMQDWQPTRGMRDFYPDDYRIREKLFSLWQDVSLKFGFEQFDAPVVEDLELLKRKAGEEIIDQIYYFQDKSGRELALRPELTPSLVRMVIANRASLKFPLKWFSVPQCFRYERMTRGRKREHYQWNLDIIGEKGQIAEAELIAVAVAVLQSLGLTSREVVVKTSSRQLLMDILTNQGFNVESFDSACLILDKRGKVEDQAIREMLKEKGMSERDIEIIFDVLKIKDLQAAKNMAIPDSPGVKALESLFKKSRILGIADFLQFDISIIRGLSYYTGIVFEAFDRESRFRAIFGGGRYDNLFEQMSKINLPACGLGFGDVVIQEILEFYGKKIDAKRKLEYVVCYTDASLEDRALQLSSRLRLAGNSVSLLYGANRAKKGLQYANEVNACLIAILDPREATNGEYIVKDLKTGEQRNIRFDQ